MRPVPAQRRLLIARQADHRGASLPRLAGQPAWEGGVQGTLCHHRVWHSQHGGRRRVRFRTRSAPCTACLVRMQAPGLRDWPPAHASEPLTVLTRWWAAQGGSNGGLLMGAEVNQVPARPARPARRPRAAQQHAASLAKAGDTILPDLTKSISFRACCAGAGATRQATQPDRRACARSTPTCTQR